MKKLKPVLTFNIRPPLLILFLFISTGLLAQKKNATGTNSVSAAYKKACGDYRGAESSLYSNSVLTAGEDCNTTIKESKSITYFTAREKVILYPGFTAVAGSNFVARIDSAFETQSRVAELPEFNDEINARNLSVSPNPFSENFLAVINSAKPAKAQISIYNMQGSKVKTMSGVNLIKGANRIPFNYSDLAPGVYMLEVNFGDSKMVKKIIKDSQ